MIDTIVLTLSKNMFSINEPDKFTPSADWIIKKNSWTARGIRSKQNPTKKELKAKIYKPRLTLFHHINLHGKQEIVLRIEISLPKLLFGNNFDELAYKDFDQVNLKLVDTLKSMGVIITASNLACADVAAIHYSKNIPLIDGSTPYHYINKIKQANIKLSLDTNQTDYRNEGHSYKWHCNTYEIVFYDKIRDLEKARLSEKRSLEKDNALQLNLFEKLKKRKKKFEVFRMEVRLNKRAKIRQLFNELNIKAALTFQKLFKPAIARKILLYYLDELESKRSGLLDYKPANDKALFTALIAHNPTLSLKQLIQLFGMRKILETISARELRVMCESRLPNGSQDRAWYRLMADLQKASLPVTHEPFTIIRKHLDKLKPLRLAQFQK